MSSGQTFKAPVGTRDIVPPESSRWEALVARFSDEVHRAGYGLVQSPMFEEVGVFQRVGEGTDVVRKEMYEFTDRGDRRLALRPEGTASVVRAFVQQRPTTPWKVYYAAPSFRYERPQAGRMRQHHQLGIEAIGSADPDLDVEVIALGWDYLRSLGLRQLRLCVNSIGSHEDRVDYVEELRGWLCDRIDGLDPEDRAKVRTHPMRVLDSKRSATRAVVAEAPTITQRLGESAASRFERVIQGLERLEIPHEIVPTLVRGLDYYTDTTFEIVSDALDTAQSTVLAGGRYDGLVSQLGGPDTPGIGFGSGIERVLLACDAEQVFDEGHRSVDVFVVDTTGGDEARDITTALRRVGCSVDRAFDGRSMRAQMKAADRSGASLAIIVGPDERSSGEVTVRDLRSEPDVDDQERLPRETMIDQIVSRLGNRIPVHPFDDKD